MNRPPIDTGAELRDVIVEPLGEFAVLVRNLMDPWRYTVALPAVTELVPARSDLGVYLDPAAPAVSSLQILKSLSRRAEGLSDSASIEIPVLYDGEDLPELEDRICQSVVSLHQTGEYTVQFIGFMPGFPYMTGLPDGLRGLPRRSTPRTRVPAGAVAIAEDTCGIYPAESPGGWWLLGRTPLKICDPRSDFFLFKPGDRVRFRAISPAEFEEFQ